MLIFLNGEFVPEERAVVSVLDRGFLYGDGLFETLRVFNGKPFRWQQHWDRLEQGARHLGIGLPFSSNALRESADQLVKKNKLPDSLLRLTLSRGIGPRGYSPKGADKPTVVMSLHPTPAMDPKSPPRWKLITSSHRLPTGEAIAQFKTCNKLPQILARAEADAAGADEGLLLNTDGFVVEGASSNLFWVDHDVVCTPALASGILPGVTRVTVLEICRSLGFKTGEANVRPDELRRMSGVFVSLSSFGVVEAQSLDGHSVKPALQPAAIGPAYWEMVRKETA